VRRLTGWLSGRVAAVVAGPAAWFGAGLTAAAGCFLGYTLFLAPPAVARVELPPRPGPVAAPPAWASPGPAARENKPAPPPLATPSPARAAQAPPALGPACLPLAADARLRVNLNTASAADLQALPGIGPAAAQHIVDARQQAPFTSVDQLHELHIVSALTLARIRDLVALQ